MMISNTVQVVHLYYFLGFGAVLCLYSTLFRVWQALTAPSAWRLFFRDVLLCVTGGVLFFLFSLSITGGTLRASFLASAAVGFAVTQATLNAVWRVVSRVLTPVWQAISSCCDRAAQNLCEKGRKFAKKVVVFLKKGLHCLRFVVYNKSAHK